ncbi:MAG: HEAT repeat domain-containing protein [Planctomycetes bacterium]|nr:HEAT repeat domain-containing protein [Planctomycetota bacterium]
MKTWRIHFLWGVVTVVTAAAWGKWVRSSQEEELRGRGKPQPTKVAETAAAPAPIPPADPAALPLPVAAPTPAAPEPEYIVRQEERLSAEALRQLVRAGNPGDVWRVMGAVQRMFKCPLKVELLMELLKGKDEQVRRSALYHLHDALEEAADRPIYREFLRTDPSDVVREAAAQLLGAREDPASVEALLQAFQKDELRVQVACAGSLNTLGQPAPAVQLIPRLAAALESPDGALRRETVERLGQIQVPQAVPVLARALRDSNGDVRLEAVNSLSNYELPEIAGLLQPLLQDPVASVRDAVKQALDQLDPNKQ